MTNQEWDERTKRILESAANVPEGRSRYTIFERNYSQNSNRPTHYAEEARAALVRAGVCFNGHAFPTRDLACIALAWFSMARLRELGEEDPQVLAGEFDTTFRTMKCEDGRYFVRAMSREDIWNDDSEIVEPLETRFPPLDKGIKNIIARCY